MKKIYYPWLLSLFPILHLYSTNVGRVNDGDVPATLLLSLFLTSLLFLIFKFFYKDIYKSALTVVVFLIFFFSYGHITISLHEHELAILEKLQLPITAILMGFLILIVWRWSETKSVASFTGYFNAVSLALLIFPSINIVTHWVSASDTFSNSSIGFSSSESINRPDKIHDSSEYPDIYYIIVDGYSSNSHLMRDYGYDNFSFTNALEEAGFIVAYDSKSNYGATLVSLASSLNLRYMPENPLSGQMNDLVYLRTLIADSEASQFLLARGYTYIYMLSGYLIPSRIADVNVDFTKSGVIKYGFETTDIDLQSFSMTDIIRGRFYKESFYRFVAETTFLRSFGSVLNSLYETNKRPYNWSDPRRFFATIDELKNIPDKPEATFTFVHLLKPHGPVQMDRLGKRLSQKIDRPKPEEFFGELEFVNEQLITLVRALIEKSSTPPIIILQADHGSNLGRVWTDDKHLTYFEILNAFYLPGGKIENLDMAISPINTFRELFNTYFDSDYELLEVKHFDIPKGYRRPFLQVDVTDSSN